MSEFTNPTASAGASSDRKRRLLIVKFGAIGDVIMAIPAAAAMHAEGYAVDWVAGTTVAPVLALYPWIHVIPVAEKPLLQGKVTERLRGVLRLWRTLRRRVAIEGPYDLDAVLYYDRRYRLLTLPLFAKRHIQLSEQDRAFRLLPGRHHTDEYARILSGRRDGELPGQLAPVMPQTLPPNPLPRAARPRVVLVPAGARNLLRDDALRRWPMQNYVAIAEQLLREGYEVILSGGPEDDWASTYFAALVNSAAPDQFTDLIGSLSLVQSLAVFDSATVVVTHDTGPLHLAGITSAAVVTIFGPTDPHGRLPQRPNCVALWGGEGFACRPCYDGRDYAPCADNGCVQQITPAMVMAEVRRLLEARELRLSYPPCVIVPSAINTLPGATALLTQIQTSGAGGRA